jgi:WD40-like Beta Propeller Repeat
MKRLALLLALAAPAVAAPQGFAPRSRDLGQSLRELERLSLSRGDLHQTVIVPERAGQNQVNWYDFEWLHFDIPSPSGGKGGVRLYFYRRERVSAERALPAIRNAYLRLVDQFHYTPTKQIPYILYSSKREFQTTNVFEVSESVLGVTSPRDLKMSLPYFGDHEKFREVSTHEMVHQFTIQKMLDIAAADELHFIDNLPLWFIEGIAEYYSKGGMDGETDRYLRDLVWNPDPEHRYQVIPFAEDRYRGYIPTYKLGQARVAFIAEVYGPEKVQALIENAYVPGGGASSSASAERGFAGLVRRVLNEPVEQVDTRWRTWLKRRYYPEYMKVRQDLPQLRDYTDLPAEPEAFAASPDGWLVLFRGIDRERGRARLYLFDVRHPRGAVEVAGDNQPGVESLHPIEQNVLAVGDGKLAFTAQAASTDALYVVPFRHRPPAGGKSPRIELGSRRRVELRHPEGLRFIEVSDPAFSPDGKRIAFAGLTDRGQRDIYVVDEGGGTARQLTDDPFAERDLAWGPEGIYFASDATDHGLLNLFRIGEAGGAVTRLTTSPFDDRHPHPLADGTLIYTGYAGGRPDLYRLQDGQARRITDFATGLDSPAPAPAGRGIFASTFYRGRFKLVEVPKVAWLEDPPVAVAAPAGPALEIPRQAIPERVPRYQPLTWDNWHNDFVFVTGGGGAGAFAGQAAMLFSDLLRDQQLLLDASVLGSWDYTQGVLLYQNRSQRLHWVAGAYLNGGQ